MLVVALGGAALAGSWPSAPSHLDAGDGSCLLVVGGLGTPLVPCVAAGAAACWAVLTSPLDVGWPLGWVGVVGPVLGRALTGVGCGCSAGVLEVCLSSVGGLLVGFGWGSIGRALAGGAGRLVSRGDAASVKVTSLAVGFCSRNRCHCCGSVKPRRRALAWSVAELKPARWASAACWVGAGLGTGWAGCWGAGGLVGAG